MQDLKIVFCLRLDCVNLSACFEAVVYYLLILYISQGEQSESLTAGIAQLKKQLSQVSELNLGSMILLHLCINCYKLMHMV